MLLLGLNRFQTFLYLYKQYAVHYSTNNRQNFILLFVVTMS